MGPSVSKCWIGFWQNMCETWQSNLKRLHGRWVLLSQNVGLAKNVWDMTKQYEKTAFCLIWNSIRNSWNGNAEKYPNTTSGCWLYIKILSKAPSVIHFHSSTRATTQASSPTMSPSSSWMNLLSSTSKYFASQATHLQLNYLPGIDFSWAAN